MSHDAVKVLVATFDTEDGASRALTTLAGGVGDLGMSAVVVRTEKDKVRFVETHDRTSGQGALQGAGWGAVAGIAALIFAPVVSLAAIPLGAGVGALVGKFRDTGYEDDDLRELGADIAPGQSALVTRIDDENVEKARRLLAEIPARQMIVKEVDADLARVLDEEAVTAGALPPGGGSPT
jgi:uncharacterized membrane protein